jgi:hypothetical protein
MSFEAVESIDPRDHPGAPVSETVLGTYESEDEAIAAAREARESFLESGSLDYAWWIVRVPGVTVARWIADSTSSKEFVLDLRSGELVEY